MKTTLEMDGVLTEQDIRDHQIIMAQCIEDFEYSRWDRSRGDFRCSYCGGDKYVPNSGVSLRTYNPANHNKNKRPKAK